jgi:hypothetical protein
LDLGRSSYPYHLDPGFPAAKPRHSRDCLRQSGHQSCGVGSFRVLAQSPLPVHASSTLTRPPVRRVLHHPIDGGPEERRRPPKTSNNERRPYLRFIANFISKPVSRTSRLAMLEMTRQICNDSTPDFVYQARGHGSPLYFEPVTGLLVLAVRGRSGAICSISFRRGPDHKAGGASIVNASA